MSNRDNHRSKVAAAESKVKSLRSKEDKAQRNALSGGGAVAKYQQEIRAANDALEALRQNVAERTAAVGEAEAARDEADRTRNDAMAGERKAKLDLADVHTNLRKAKELAKAGPGAASNAMSRMNRFTKGNGVAPSAAWNHILKRRKEFHRLPIGPIGASISLSNESLRWCSGWRWM